ncbi:hypothetical protein E1301_Tti009827 [Triplophysa tibetana]|uniref:Uncharacterized protein n=1 Tax=Triplophysa tibetana TaxID=1572043 RepID=A0A5A9N7U5_9TELE|nr:hypothetical protein E1301_Tti009827 [Triplophysa tibetana]
MKDSVTDRQLEMSSPVAMVTSPEMLAHLFISGQRARPSRSVRGQAILSRSEGKEDGAHPRGKMRSVNTACDSATERGGIEASERINAFELRDCSVDPPRQRIASCSTQTTHTCTLSARRSLSPFTVTTFFHADRVEKERILMEVSSEHCEVLAMAREIGREWRLL